MVGADAPEKILKIYPRIYPSRSPKKASFLKKFLKQNDFNKAIFYYHESVLVRLKHSPKDFIKISSLLKGNIRTYLLLFAHSAF